MVLWRAEGRRYQSTASTHKRTNYNVYIVVVGSFYPRNVTYLGTVVKYGNKAAAERLGLLPLLLPSSETHTK